MRPRRAAAKVPLLGWIGVGVGLAVVAGLGALALSLRPVPLDPESLCRLNAAPTAHTLVLIDATDPLEARHRRALEALAAQEAGRLAPGDRFSVLAVNAETPREPTRLFSRCNPGGGRLVNPLIGNPKQAEARYTDAFLAPLTQALKRAQSPRRSAEQSPLTETLRAVAADPAFQDTPARRLVLVSDLLEFTAEGANSYSDAPLTAPRSAALTGVSVRVIVIDRPAFEARQDRALAELWQPFLTASGAADITIDPRP